MPSHKSFRRWSSPHRPSQLRTYRLHLPLPPADRYRSQSPCPPPSNRSETCRFQCIAHRSSSTARIGNKAGHTCHGTAMALATTPPPTAAPPMTPPTTSPGIPKLPSGDRTGGTLSPGLGCSCPRWQAIAEHQHHDFARMHGRGRLAAKCPAFVVRNGPQPCSDTISENGDESGSVFRFDGSARSQLHDTFNFGGPARRTNLRVEFVNLTFLQLTLRP